jgi:membrane-associated phospholipid phosphatase
MELSSGPTSFARHPRQESIIIVAALALLGICMLVVRDGDVGSVEKAVFNSINSLPDWLKAPMWVFQIFGALVFVAAVALAAVAIRRYRLGLALMMAIPLKLALEWWVVKALVERERPAFTVPDAIIRDVNTSPLGFPSGHAVFAFALAGLLAPYLGRRGKAIIFSLAVLNALARVYLGAHNPLDVVAGAALGAAIAAGLNLAVGVPAAGSQEPPPADWASGNPA